MKSDILLRNFQVNRNHQTSFFQQKHKLPLEVLDFPFQIDFLRKVVMDAQKILDQLNITMLKNREFTVEITGNSDPDELESISAQRAKKAVNYLINKGISITKIIEKDDGKYKPTSKTDRSKNMRVGIKFFSNSMEDVVKNLAR